MAIQIDKAKFDMRMEDRKFRLQIATAVVASVAAAGTLLAAGAALMALTLRLMGKLS